MAVNWLYGALILDQTNLARTDKSFYYYKNDTQILFFGDSHTKNAFNPMFINNSFNFASEGESYLHTYFKLRKILEFEDFKPTIVVLPIDLNSFASYRLKGLQDEWYWKRYIDFNEISGVDTGISPIITRINMYFPFIGNGENFMAYMGGRSKLFRGYIFGYANFSSLDTKEELASQIANFHFKDSVIVDENLFSYFKEVLDLAEERNISVILVKFPVTGIYYNSTEKYFHDKGAYYEKIRNVTGSHDNVYILDYQKIYFDNMSLFRDPHHLNVMGAEALSKRFIIDLGGIRAVSYFFKP